MAKAVCPGSFDPVTIGHLDIIRRAAAMFEEVIVLVLTNAAKKHSFTVEERMDLIKRSTTDIPNIRIDTYDGLLVDYARIEGAQVIVRGLRAISDFEYEFQMSLTNKKLNPEVETVFLTTNAENLYLSSSIVKQIASLGGDISGFVHKDIAEDIKMRLYKGGLPK